MSALALWVCIAVVVGVGALFVLPVASRIIEDVLEDFWKH